jgi:S1-C subfamily serine protease
VSQNGIVLTNHHVVDGCADIRIPAENASAKTIVVDHTNDLALIKINVANKSTAAFPESDDVKQGQDVFVFGFPLDGFLPSAGNITAGIVSALAGPGNNSSLIQITAPVQPGNSGGPLLDRRGRVMGVIVSKANTLKIASAIGDIPQNVNFAISMRTVKSFLDGNGVEYRQRRDSFGSLFENSVAIADEAKKVSVKIECWRQE